MPLPVRGQRHCTFSGVLPTLISSYLAPGVRDVIVDVMDWKMSEGRARIIAWNFDSSLMSCIAHAVSACDSHACMLCVNGGVHGMLTVLLGVFGWSCLCCFEFGLGAHCRFVNVCGTCVV